jgi:osomolarity two-component system, sensor histidine kinase SLN1
MRIPIREQLGLVILLSSLIGLAVVSIATWVSNHSFVLSVRSSRLSLTASLKAAQLASNLNLMQTAASFISTRVLIQYALERYNIYGNNSVANWSNAANDMADALSGTGSLGQQLLLQSMIFPKEPTGPMGASSVMNTTSAGNNDTILLPYTCPNGSAVYLGDRQCGELNLGYPPMLYPNFTYLSVSGNGTLDKPEVSYEGVVLQAGSSPLLLGPYQVNDTFFLVSMTMPIVNNTSSVDVLGWLTVVMDAMLISEVIASNQGLEQTGETLLVGPVNNTNRFPANVMYNTDGGNPAPDFAVEYLIPLNKSYAQRHPNHTLGTSNPPFNASQYPAVYNAFAKATGQDDNSGAIISSNNEAGDQVSVGYAMPVVGEMVDWAILVEQARSEVWQPINHLRDILLACVLPTAALMAIIAFPMAHLFSLPIRRLREATARSIEPPNVTPSRSSFDSLGSGHDGARDAEETGDAEARTMARKEGHRNPVGRWRDRRREERDRKHEARRRRQFKIPGKVKERKSCIKDELTDLTSTL